MGAISFNLDENLIRELRRHLPVTFFVETGTFRGETLATVQSLFAQCVSIELSQEYYEAAQERFAGFKHIRVLHGDSAQVLTANRELFAGQSTLFWLDAHWCAADNTAGEKSQCPLLDELAAIGTLNNNSALLIDDARLFLNPPPVPHEISDWPMLDDVLLGLRKLSAGHAVVYFNDVILFLPKTKLTAICPFLQKHAFNLLTYADKARDYDALLKQAHDKETELRSITTIAEERAQSLIQSNHEADRLRTDAAKLTAELKVKETALLAAHAERQQLAVLQQCCDERLDLINRLSEQNQRSAPP